jgi:hypothetical protein
LEGLQPGREMGEPDWEVVEKRVLWEDDERQLILLLLDRERQPVCLPGECMECGVWR